MSRAPHAGERPPKATAQERQRMIVNLWCIAIGGKLGKLSDESYRQAVLSARANPGKAARCYAAIVRSYLPR